MLFSASSIQNTLTLSCWKWTYIFFNVNFFRSMLLTASSTKNIRTIWRRILTKIFWLVLFSVLFFASSIQNPLAFCWRVRADIDLRLIYINTMLFLAFAREDIWTFCCRKLTNHISWSLKLRRGILNVWESARGVFITAVLAKSTNPSL